VRPAQVARREAELRPSRQLDIEADVGFVVGTPSEPGCRVPATALADHVFGVLLVND
jgi:fumarylacetoacetase